MKRIEFPPRSPKLKAYAEKLVRSLKDEMLSRLILLGESLFRYTLKEYVAPYHEERPHQGKDNGVLFPTPRNRTECEGSIPCRERLGG